MGDYTGLGNNEIHNFGISIVSLLRTDINSFKDDIRESKHRIKQEIRNIKRCTKVVIQLEKQLKRQLEKEAKKKRK